MHRHHTPALCDILDRTARSDDDVAAIRTSHCMVSDPMATPSDPKPALSYSEHDKLGPLGAKTSAIQDAAALRGALIRAFEAAAHDAREAVAAIDKGSAPAAVHAARKALRRARAVLGLVGGALPRSERRAVKTALQDARRALSTVRDHA